MIINDLVIESKSSKKIEVNLNPFNSEDYNIEPSESSEPIIINNLIGLDNCNFVLNNWYNKSLIDLTHKMLIIIGPTGCGKTTLVDQYCKNNNIIIYKVYNKSSKKDLIKEILNFSEYTKNNIFEENSKIKKLIFIDEYQNGQHDLLTISDINNLKLLRCSFQTTLAKNITKDLKTIFGSTFVKIPPILIISSNSKGTKLSDLKKVNEVYYINEIPPILIKTWIMSIYNYPEQFLINIISKCKSDKRLLLNTLEYYKKSKDDFKLDEFIDSFYKDSEVNHFEFIGKLFDKDTYSKDTYSKDIFKVYETDGYLLSYLVQENYLDYNQDIDNIANSAESISYAETIYSDTFDSQRSFMPESHCLNSIIIPSYFSKTTFKKNQLRSSSINNRFNILLNNKKIIEKINLNEQNLLTIFDIYYIKKFLTNDLLKSKNFTDSQNDLLKKFLFTFTDSRIEKLELIYKHFNEFKESELKSKNFTIKFKEKLNKIIKENG